ncbi:chaperonin 10-like protein [Boletus reticuloceps]|uniref:Chaperonin 10-like protein n=1 Tax=Boletus reticuloceps TaxID=495285 RepID=A0A8I2YIN0_9AGAM|nr:chaperonin 10-like protein [Boletus reticuloceps]
MTTQKAPWLPKIGAQFALGRNAIPEPGPGEALVKLKASALNHVDVHIQKSGLFEIEEYPVILGEEGAGVVLKVGDGVRNLARGGNVFVPSSLTLSHAEACGMRVLSAEHVHLDKLFQATFNNIMKYGSLVLAEIATKMPPNLSYEEAAASILIAFAPFAVATYAQRPQGIALTPPFEEGGLGKYAGRPIVIFGGAASVGQQAIQLAKLSGFSPRLR